MFDNKNWKRYVVFLIVASISIFALFLRFDKLLHHELWLDEFVTLSVMNEGFGHFIKELPKHEVGGYLNLDHFLIYPFFKVFSFNKWGLAIPHIIITAIGFYLLYLISKRYFKTVWGYIVTFSVFCFNATLINHATEIRPYAVLPTLALANLYLSEMLINEIDLSPIKKFFIGAFFLLTICFHTYGIFILFTCLTYALLNKPHARTFSDIFKSISKVLIAIFLIGLPFWLFWLFIFGPVRVRFASAEFETFQFIPNPCNNIAGFLKGVFGNLLGFKKFYFLLVALVFPFVFPYKERIKQISFLVIMVFFPILLILATDVAASYWFIQRQFIWAMPYFAIFLGWSCDSFMNYISTKLSFIKG